MGLFSKTQTKNPKDQVNDWNSRLRKESRLLDRQIRSIQREEEKVKRTMKDAAKKGEIDVCKMLAKEVVQSRRAVTRIYTSQAHLNSVQCQMKAQLATLRVAGALAASTEVMRAMQQLVKLPEVAKVMQDLSKEMMRAGIIEEMLEDTLDVMEPDELEEEVEEEVDKVLWEVTAGMMGKAPAAPADALPAPAAVAPAKEEEEEPEEELKEMRSRLEALRS